MRIERIGAICFGLISTWTGYLSLHNFLTVNDSLSGWIYLITAMIFLFAMVFLENSADSQKKKNIINNQNEKSI